MANSSSADGDLGFTNQKIDKRVQHLESKAIHLTICYLILQVLIIFSSSSAKQCRNWWVPFSFSLIISTLYFDNFLNTISLFLHVRNQYDLHLLEEAETIRRIRMTRFGSAQELEPEPFRVNSIKRRFWIGGLILCLALFGAIVAIACFVVPCSGEVDFQVLYESIMAETWKKLL